MGLIRAQDTIYVRASGDGFKTIASSDIYSERLGVARATN